MRIEIITKNFKAKDTLKDLLEKKIAKFDKYFRKEAVAKVRLSGIGNGKFSMEITIVADGTHIRSEFTSENMYDNIDIILPKIERQIAKYRKKFENRLNKDAFNEPFIYDSNAVQEDELKTKPPKLVKTKNFELSMMSVEGAVEEMDLIGHNFYVFINADDEKVSVLYKRNDGDYGLISPEYSR